MRRLLLLTVLALATFHVVEAHDHRPPALTLHAGNGTQSGRVLETWWTERQGPDVCVHQNVIGPSEFPSNPPTMSYLNDQARIVIGRPVRPRVIRLYSWVIVAPSGPHLGPAREVPFLLGPSQDGAGNVVWVATFWAPNPGDSYLELRAEWDDEEGCGGSQGGFWRFTLRALI